MKAITLTAVMATIVAIPILISKHREKVRKEQESSGPGTYEDPRRYDVFDFVGN